MSIMLSTKLVDCWACWPHLQLSSHRGWMHSLLHYHHHYFLMWENWLTIRNNTVCRCGWKICIVTPNMPVNHNILSLQTLICFAFSIQLVPTVVQQLTRIRLTMGITQSICGSRAFCLTCWKSLLNAMSHIVVSATEWMLLLLNCQWLYTSTI